MGLLDDYSSGIGSPRPKWQHQDTIANAIEFMRPELRKRALRIFPEATVSDDWDDKAPDLVIFNRNMIPVSIIEITRTYQLDAIIEKCHELMSRFPDSEYFVYDYEEDNLYQFNPYDNQWLSSVEYELHSQYLKKPVLHYLTF